LITVNKKLKGFIPYRIVWFPTTAALQSMATELPLTHAARVGCADTDLKDASCMVEHHLSLTLLLDLRRPLDSIFSEFNATVRRKIRLAEKLGRRVRLRRYSGGEQNAGFADEFVALFNELVHQKPGVLSPTSRQLVESYFPHAELFLVDLDDRLICSHLMMRDSEAGKSRLLNSASRRFEDPATSRLAGILNVYLHWYELQTYHDAGFAAYDFGGVSPVDDLGINRFKLQFGVEVVREHNYLFAGMPLLWRTAFRLFTTFSGRGKRRRAVERAGDKWRDMPLDQIQQLIKGA
jgi:Acetyltransferase (GNAT) domain